MNAFTRRALLGAGIGLAAGHSALRAAYAADPVVAALEAALADAVARDAFVGVALVLQGDTPLLQTVVGPADLATGTPNTVDTGFQIASISKTLTGALMLLLREEGALALDDPAARWLPDAPNLARDGVDVTIRHLLTHTAGVPDLVGLFEPRAPQNSPQSPAAMRAMIEAMPLAFTPGERFTYSTSGYVLLGAIVEAITGESYEDAARARILAPLGMTRTWIAPPADPGPLATGFTKLGPLVAPISQLFDPRLVGAGGGWTSTIGDLARWHAALRDGTLLAPALVAEMTAPAVVVPEPPGGAYGLGMELQTIAGEAWWGHKGVTVGFRSALMHFPELDVAILILANRLDIDPDILAADLVTAIGAATS